MLARFSAAEMTEWLCRSSTEGQHLAPALGALQKVRPVLHHPGAWLQIEGVVVSRAHCIPGSMGKLQLDMVMRVTLLVQDGGRQPAKAVAGHAAFVAHALQSFQDGVVAHRLLALRSPGKSHSPFPVNSRNISSTSRACLANGTMCGVRIFMRSAGMSQRAFSRSNSAHFASINSWCARKSWTSASSPDA